MSLVGPRPHLPEEVAKYQKHHKAVLKIKPGMTGLAQVSGRSDLDFEEEVRLDNYYIKTGRFGSICAFSFKPLARFFGSARLFNVYFRFHESCARS